jgi:uncharacterized protein YjaZ
MSIQSHILLKSGRLSPFVKYIEKVISETVPLVQNKIPISDVDIVVYDNPLGAIPEIGIGGYTPGAHLIFISIDPSFEHLHTTINTQLNRTLAHELHHSLRWHNPGYGETLIDALVTEGLADHFDLEIFGGLPQPWSAALSGKEDKELMEKAKGEFSNKNYDYSSWFFGNEKLGIPRWTGYSLGYRIVEEYLKKHSKTKPSLLYAAKTREFISDNFDEK